MAKKRGFQISEETTTKIKIISAQGFISEDEVVEKAIEVLYAIMPSERDARYSVEDKIKEATSSFNNETITDQGNLL